MAFPSALPSDATLLKAQDFVADTLRASMTNSQNTIPVNDATKFPDPAGAVYYVTIDAVTSATREICGYTGRDLTGGANNLTGATRHLFSTNNVAHGSGVTIEQTIVAAFHEAPKTEIIAIATKVGIDGSGVTTTHDYKLSGVTGSDKAVSKTGTETLTNKTLTAPIETTPSWGTSATITTATFTVIPGATSVSFRNNANTFDNLLIADNGNITVRGTLGSVTTLTATTVTATSLGGTITTAAQPNITSLGTLTALGINGDLTFSGASRRIIAGTTDWALRDTGNANSNILVTDAGAVTFRSTVGGITTLTATTLAGTLSTAAQPNVTSLGTLTSLTVAGAVTISTGAITVNTAGTATFNRQYYAAKFAATFSATPTIDFNNSNVQSMTLTGNITTLTLSNAQSGGRYILVFTQDVTGGRTITWPAAVKWSGGTAPTLSLANKIDVVGLIYDGTNYYGTSSTNY